MKQVWRNVCILLVFAAIAIPQTGCCSVESVYKSAQNLLSKGQYSQAAEQFESIGSFEDSTLLAMYCKACALCELGDYEIGLSVLESMGSYKDCPYRVIYYKARAYEDYAGTDILEYMIEAQNIYKTIPLFLDSKERIDLLDARIVSAKIAQYDANYQKAEELFARGEYFEAYNVFASQDGYKDSALKAEIAYLAHKSSGWEKTTIGNSITFGTYEQDGNNSNGKEEIEWIVLSKENNCLLLISRYVVDRNVYNEEHTDTTWETCTLRRWLNNDFLNAAFSDYEQSMIPLTMVSADKNPEYETNPGNATYDKVFLLSIKEVETFFESDKAMKCKPTAYAREKGANQSSDGFCWWWLRSPGSEQSRAASVLRLVDGGVNEHGVVVSYDLGDGGIRPAMWIDLNALTH